MDFTITTTPDRADGKLAFEFARRNGAGSVVTKANVIKTTDGKFLNICEGDGEEYPEIETDEWRSI